MITILVLAGAAAFFLLISIVHDFQDLVKKLEEAEKEEAKKKESKAPTGYSGRREPLSSPVAYFTIARFPR